MNDIRIESWGILIIMIYFKTDEIWQTQPNPNN